MDRPADQPRSRHDPAGIEARVLAPPTVPEIVAYVLGVALVVMVFPSMSNHGLDWSIFVSATEGNYVADAAEGHAWFYPYWWLPPLEFLAALGDTAGYVTLGIANLTGFWFASRVFGGRPALALVSFFPLMVAFTGTMTGVLAAAAAGLWWALHRDRMWLAGLLATFTLAKLQWSVPLVVAMVLLSPTSWRDRTRIAAAIVAIGVASVAIYGLWPLDLLERANDGILPAGNGSLWRFVGPAVIVLWIPTVVLPMASDRRLALTMATACLAVPYIQQYDFSLLMTLRFSWLGLFSWNRGWMVAAWGEDPARLVLLAIPAAFYLLLVVPAARRWWVGRTETTSSQGLGLDTARSPGG